MIFTRTGRRMTRRERKHGEVSMKEIDERYIAALDAFGFGMFRTKVGVNIYHTTSTGTFMINLNGEDFVDMLVNLLTSVNRLNKKIRKRLLPGAVKHPATLISRQHSLSAENHRNSSSEIINRHQKMAENAEIQ